MLRYEVTLSVDPALAGRLEAYMRGKHVPEILATGCFADVRFERADGADGVTFRTVYHAARREQLERYLAEHTAAFRADFLAHFPSGVAAVRRVWVEIETWTRSGG
jgi:hypothetical protein